MRPFASLHSLASSDLDSYRCLLLGTGSIAWLRPSSETEGQIMSGGEGKSKQAGKYGSKKKKERPEELFSPFFTFFRAIFPALLDFLSPPLSAPGSPSGCKGDYDSL